MTTSILIVEDDLDLADLLHYNLSQAGFNCQLMHNGSLAWQWLQQHTPKLALLDIMLPGIDGLELCRRIRGQGNNIAIIMLTAKGEEVDKIVGLELGADDYLTKPFSMRELVLRIKAVLRRNQPDQSGPALKFQHITIDTDSHQVWLDGRQLSLTATEFALLLYLAQRPGRVLGRELLLEQVWGYSAVGYARTVDTHMRRLRQKLAPAENCLETVRAVGYRFNSQHA